MILVYNFHIFLDAVDLGWQYEILRQIRSVLITLHRIPGAQGSLGLSGLFQSEHRP